MELKTLKIDSDLHEKLKELADDKNTSMQNLIEKKLSELVSHEDDILFDIDNIKYDSQFKKYGLQLSEESFNKLITFFEIFLTNRNLKNVKEIENLLQIISKLKSYETNKIELIKQQSRESVNKTFTKEEEFINMIKEVTNQTATEQIEKEKNDVNDFNYDNIMDKYNNGLRQLLNQIDSVRFNIAKKDSTEKYETLNGHSFVKNNQDIYNKEKKDYLEIVEISLRNNFLKNNYLHEGDIIKDPKTNYEYKIEKIYSAKALFENPSYVLKGVTAMVIDVETLYSKEELIKHNFLLGDKLLLEVIDTIDFEYERNISKLLQIKDVAYDLLMGVKEYKSSKSITSDTEIDEKINTLEKNINEELDYETMKSVWIKTKVWFEELKIRA